jgi:hypothetical protein
MYFGTLKHPPGTEVGSDADTISSICTLLHSASALPSVADLGPGFLLEAQPR